MWIVYLEIFIYDKLTKKEEAKKRSKEAINFKVLFQDLKMSFNIVVFIMWSKDLI